jgi:hypothetical protein
VSQDIKHDRKRILVMAVIVAVAAVAAVASAVGAFQFGHHWLLAPFVAALVAGFGAQIWFIVGFRPKKGA